MSRTNFERLDVYRLSEKLADLTWDVVLKWDAFARDTVGKQVVCAADSIEANIAEGLDVAATRTTAVSSARPVVR